MTRTIEAFAVFHRQKEILADYTQVASAALALLRRNIDVPDAPEMLGAMVDACGVKHWGKGKRYNRAIEKVDSGRAALANQGVIQQAAAFDFFSRNLLLDVMRFSPGARATMQLIKHDHRLLMLSPQRRWVVSHCCNDVVSNLGALSSRLDDLKSWIGWAPSEKLTPTLPLFDLLRRIRNRIAHDDAMIGSDLEEFSGGSEVRDAVRAFQTNYARGEAPSLPVFERGKRLQLEPVNAIFFGAFLYEIAKELNAHATGLLDDGGFIDMAFFYSMVVDEHPFRTKRHRSAEARINYFLIERYLRGDGNPGAQAIIQRLNNETLIAERPSKLTSTAWRVALDRHAQLLS